MRRGLGARCGVLTSLKYIAGRADILVVSPSIRSLSPSCPCAGTRRRRRVRAGEMSSEESLNTVRNTKLRTNMNTARRHSAVAAPVPGRFASPPVAAFAGRPTSQPVIKRVLKPAAINRPMTDGWTVRPRQTRPWIQQLPGTERVTGQFVILKARLLCREQAAGVLAQLRA